MCLLSFLRLNVEECFYLMWAISNEVINAIDSRGLFEVNSTFTVDVASFVLCIHYKQLAYLNEFIYLHTNQS